MIPARHELLTRYESASRRLAELDPRCYEQRCAANIAAAGRLQLDSVLYEFVLAEESLLRRVERRLTTGVTP